MISFLILSVVFCQTILAEEYSVPEHVDLDTIIKNDRLFRNYIDCILQKGKCTPEGEKLRHAIPEALTNDCAKCNEKHKSGIKKIIHHLIENKKDWWNEVQEKYDPKGEYKAKYSTYLEQEGLSY